MASPNDDVSRLRAEVEQLHYRLDEVVREFAALRRMLGPDHQANGYEMAGAVRDLVEQLKRPTKRNSTINLPSGPVHMTVTETRS
ncbi:MAG: hypothetical protein WCB10_12055 [Steroidobacteraceae bacterium]